jgi:hypothetical protein
MSCKIQQGRQLGQWRTKPPREVLRDAQSTLQTLHKSMDAAAPGDVKRPPPISQMTHRFVWWTISKMRKLGVQNAGLHRALKAQRAGKIAAAYPQDNRPRGDKDIQSVMWHIETLSGSNRSRVSPIVVWKYKPRTRLTQYCLLDGVHRLVAAAMCNRRVRVMLVM